MGWEGALMHVGVGRIDVPKYRAQFAQISAGVFCRAEIRLADDFHQRNSRPIKIDQAHAFGVDIFAGIFFDMDSREADSSRFVLTISRQIYIATFEHRSLVLTNLTALSKHRVEIAAALGSRARRV